MASLKKIHFHGYLREIFPEPLELAVETVEELFKALSAQTKALHPKPGQERHVLRVVGFDNAEDLFKPTDKEELHIVPAFAGGKSGFIKVALGVALVAAAIAMPANIAGLAVVEGVTIGSIAWGLGASLLLGGLLELLSPAPKMDLGGEQDPEASKYLGAPKNTVEIGTRIPILYGEHMVHGHFLSFNVDAKEVSTS